MFEQPTSSADISNPRLVRLAREVGAEIPLPPLREKNAGAAPGLSSLLSALRSLLHFGTRRA